VAAEQPIVQELQRTKDQLESDIKDLNTQQATLSADRHVLKDQLAVLAAATVRFVFTSLCVFYC